LTTDPSVRARWTLRALATATPNWFISTTNLQQQQQQQQQLLLLLQPPAATLVARYTAVRPGASHSPLDKWASIFRDRQNKKCGSVGRAIAGRFEVLSRQYV